MNDVQTWKKSYVAKKLNVIDKTILQLSLLGKKGQEHYVLLDLKSE
jgi:hypothetical protein